MSYAAWAELAVRARAGEAEAMDRLVGLVRPWILGVILRRGWFVPGGETEDLIQAGFVGLWEAVRAWRPETGTPFKKFASLCIIRELIGELRFATRRKFDPLNAAWSLDTQPSERWDCDWHTLLAVTDPSGLCEDPAEVALADEKRRRQREVLRYLTETLSPLERASLAVVFGWSYVEVAQRVGKPPKSIDNAFQKAKRKMRRRWAEAVALGVFREEEVA